MIQCKDCEHFHRDANGRIALSCDPFGNLKEPECLAKWQLVKINQMVEAYQATLGFYHKIAPMQDKLFKAMERELNDLDEGEQWKQQDSDDEPDRLGEDPTNPDGRPR